jgi:hypothetical protein
VSSIWPNGKSPGMFDSSMRRVCAIASLALVSCGFGALPVSHPTAAQSLVQTAEFLEFESPSTRVQLYRDLAKLSAESAASRSQPVFLILRQGVVERAPALEASVDLLQAPDAGARFELELVSRTRSVQTAFSEDRREAYQGLSEREVAELVARSLLERWKVADSNAIAVERAPGAPYAAALIDDVLRINPALLYLAAARSAP